VRLGDAKSLIVGVEIFKNEVDLEGRGA